MDENEIEAQRAEMRAHAVERFRRNKPTETDPKLKEIFLSLDDEVFEGSLPLLEIAYVKEGSDLAEGGVVGVYFFHPDKFDLRENYILVNPDVPDSQLREVICHEMVHFKTHMIDYEKGIEFFSEKSCCPNGENGGHEGMFKTLAAKIHDRFGYRVDQYYVNVMKSALKNAGEQDWKDDGKEYDYTFYKAGGRIVCQKIREGARHMDRFPLFHGRIPELNDVPPTPSDNPFEDRFFADEKILNVYTRPLDSYTQAKYAFLETGIKYYSIGEIQIEPVFATGL